MSEKKFDRRLSHEAFDAIVDSMTQQELELPSLLLEGRRAVRVARGSGRPVLEVRRLAHAVAALPVDRQTEIRRLARQLFREKC